MDTADSHMDRITRLDRIESKLDKLAETMAQLARIDERQDGFEQRVNRHEFRLDLIEEQVREASEAQAARSGKGVIVERSAWIIFAAVVSSAAHFF
tara:strand:+ start:15003 stop:15290 length:288 start_codon:yes stop_codon:yes gene_type:complete